jgi:hypothetical protein
MGDSLSAALSTSGSSIIAMISGVWVCVCVCERERESVCVRRVDEEKAA